jgi:HEAT repeat protein
MCPLDAQSQYARAEALIGELRDPTRRALATRELSELRDAAIPTLIAFFDGSLLDAAGHSYSRHGEIVCCALIVVRLLGEHGRTLESFVLRHLHDGSSSVRVEAVAALAASRSRSEHVILALAGMLQDESFDVALQAADALRSLSALEGPPVLEVVSESPRAAQIIRKFMRS